LDYAFGTCREIELLLISKRTVAFGTGPTARSEMKVVLAIAVMTERYVVIVCFREM
jgi:hypothetical protein